MKWMASDVCLPTWAVDLFSCCVTVVTLQERGRHRRARMRVSDIKVSGRD